MSLLRLMVDFDGLLNPMPDGWFDIGAYKREPAKGVVKFLIAATEYFDVYIFGPRSLMFGGIQSIQAAIILWTTQDVNKETAHELMSVLQFPKEEPAYDVAINGSGVKWHLTKEQPDPEAIAFITEWQEHLAKEAGRKEKPNVPPIS